MELPLSQVRSNEKSTFVIVPGKLRVYVCYGIKAPIGSKLGADELANIIMNKIGLKDEDVKIYRSMWFKFVKFNYLIRLRPLKILKYMNDKLYLKD